MAQMKAIKVDEFGEPEVLQHVASERPPGQGRGAHRDQSAGVNYADTMRRRNQYVESQELPFTPGSEGRAPSPRRERRGRREVGDRVVTLLGTGG